MNAPHEKREAPTDESPARAGMDQTRPVKDSTASTARPTPAAPVPVRLTVYADAYRSGHPLAEDDLTWEDAAHEIEAMTREATATKELALAFNVTRFQPGAWRSDAAAIEVTAIVIDVDALDAIPEIPWAALVYASPSDPNPDGTRRVRIIAPITRALAPLKVHPVRIAFAEALGIAPGQGVEACLDPARIFFAGMIEGTPARDVWRFDGPAVDVDALLARPRLSDAWPEPVALRTDASAPRTYADNADAIEVSDDMGAGVLGALLEVWQPAGVPMGRRVIVRALGGYLARRGWGDTDIADLVRELPSDTPEARAELAVESARQARTGAVTAGYGELEAHLGPVARRLERAAKDPREPVGFSGVWSETWARVFATWARKDAVRVRMALTPMPKALTALAGADANVNASAVEPEDFTGRDAAVDDAISTLADPRLKIFQRSGQLIIVTREARHDANVVRPSGAPTIRPLSNARAREIFRTTRGMRESWVATEVLARGEWGHIRPLDAISVAPMLRPDGTVQLRNGYDPETRTLVDLAPALQGRVTAGITRKDATAALDMLVELVRDFPFASDTHLSAWIAMLLTAFARHAIDGPAPLGLIEASQRGSGKSLLADVIAFIVTGATAARRTAPKSAEEWDKSLFAALLAGDSLLMFDNVTGVLRSDALDAVITGTVYTGRVLGASEERRIPIRTTFLVTTNNAQLSSDLVRRAIVARLEPDVERPEQRTGFTHPNLLGHVRAERARYVSASLTILAAYAHAGRPAVDGAPMGSFESWTRLVRDAIVWAGGADPVVTQAALRESADVERDDTLQLLGAVHGAMGEAPWTVKELLAGARAGGPGSGVSTFGGKPGARAELLDALRGLVRGEEPSARDLGYRLRTMRGQIAGGFRLMDAGREGHGKVARYRVLKV